MISLNRDETIETLRKCLNHVECPFEVCGCYLADQHDCKEQLIENVIDLLKEQEAVKPYIDIDEAKCPNCKVKLTRQELLGDDVLFEDFFDYCPHCGRSVKWE